MPVDENKLFEATISAGQSALRVAMAVNGAAATALLALISSVFKEDKALASRIASHLPALGFGVAAAALATGLTYCTLDLQARKHRGWSEVSNWSAILLVAASYALFCIAISSVAHEFALP